MGARFRSWWQQIKKYRVTILVVAIILVVAFAFIIVGYRFDWTGFSGNSKSGKTLWDWLQLLIIPAVLAVGGYVINLTISRGEQKSIQQRDQTERDIAKDNQQEAALQDYFDKMSELLLEKHLRASQPSDEVRKIARVRTLRVLSRLDNKRKGNVLQYQYETGLIYKDNCIIDLSSADLRFADLLGADLGRADLSGVRLGKAVLGLAFLNEADLSGADLSEADLMYTSLSKAKLSRTYLMRAHLEYADLTGAFLYEAYLHGAFLREATLGGANLRFTWLIGADLRGADLTGAELGMVGLSKAELR